MAGVLGFELRELTSWSSFLRLLYRPTDAASLGVVRALFGFLMIFDVPEERGLSTIDIRWGDPLECRFPFLHFLQPLPLQWMCLVYLLMWLGAAGIMLGFCFRVSCLTYVLTYWYVFLLDKSVWNNHSYLYGLIAILLLFSQAQNYCSIDSMIWPKINQSVPLWNYAILRYQIFILYFIAGLKKLDPDWLNGYSMVYIANHWVFTSFREFFSTEAIEYWMVHIGGFMLDLTVGFWLFFDQTRVIALLFCASFHVMNSQLFTIGMFPYVCLVTMLLYCHPAWPRSFLKHFISGRGQRKHVPQENKPPTREQNKKVKIELTKRANITVFFLVLHVFLQAFLPFSHFITQGYNNWTNGLYGYSWDMMVHNWQSVRILPRITDLVTGQEHDLDENAWVQNDRWSKHADMVSQWARCVDWNLRYQHGLHKVAVHVDVWCSLNSRFQQRMYDPRVDLLTADWSPWRRPSWVMPLLLELSDWRSRMRDIEKHVFSWSNSSDVQFIADFPGLSIENYMGSEMSNVTLSVLSGKVVLEQFSKDRKRSQKVTLKEGESMNVTTEAFHSVHTVHPTPSCYLYTFNSETDHKDRVPSDSVVPASSSLMRQVQARYNNFRTALQLVGVALWNITSQLTNPHMI